MTNKINGIDVSKYFIEIVDEGGSTINYKILPNFDRLLVERIFEQNQQLKRLQKENEGLKSLNDFNIQKIEVLQEENKRLNQELDIKEKMLDKFMIGSGETLEKLQKENEELKKLKCKFKEYCTCDIEKYRSALEEIRKQYIHSIFYKCDKTEKECPCHNCIILGQLDRVQNIVKIIDEALNDRD